MIFFNVLKLVLHNTLYAILCELQENFDCIVVFIKRNCFLQKIDEDICVL